MYLHDVIKNYSKLDTMHTTYHILSMYTISNLIFVMSKIGHHYRKQSNLKIDVIKKCQ